MIIKNKEQISSKNVRQIAGDKQEKDVAFFLRRAYKNDEKVFVFNDLRFEHNDEIAQIDHLILYPYGFVLIESKSITGEIKINNNQEWTRSYRQQWSGIRSPIKQVELQEKLLRELLLDNKEQLMPKFLFGILQQGFKGRCWDHICAVSSNAIVHRDEIPNVISKKLVKSEFVVDKLTKLMNIPKNKIITTLKAGDSRPEFSTESMNKISDFLIQHHKPINPQQAELDSSKSTLIHSDQIIENKQNKATDYIEKPITREVTQSTKEPEKTQTLACKKCNNIEGLQGAWGKFGYYVKCSSCNTNTAMKQNCPSCDSKNTKINKQKEHYYLTCQDCNTHIEIFTQGKIIEIEKN